jgi:thiol-disulfide isomerase/thioredoxin
MVYEIRAEAALDQKQYAQAIAAVKAGQSLQPETTVELYLLEARIWERLSLNARAELALLQAWRKGSDEAQTHLKAIYERTHRSLDGFESYLEEKRHDMAAAASGGKDLPSFKVSALDGQQFNLPALRGKVVVLNFWFIGCAPCRAEIPDLNKLVAEFKDKNVVFLAMALDKQEELRKFLKKVPFNYHIIPDAGEFITEKMRIRAFPTHIILGPEGHVEATFEGGGQKRQQELRLLISSLLEGK